MLLCRSDPVQEFHLAVTQLDCRRVLCILRIKGGFIDTVNSRDCWLRTATMLIAKQTTSDCRGRSHVRRSMLDILLEAGAKLDVVDNAGNTALMHSVLSSSEDVVDWLLDAGADAGLTNNVGVTPLWQSVFDVVSRHKHHQWPIVRRLLTADGDLDQKCRGPLLFAYGTEHVYCYEDPVSALDLAIDGGCQSTARLLVGAGCSCSASQMMAMADHDTCFSWLDDLLAESRSLQHLCRLVIRRCIGLRLDVVVQKLPIPVQLRSFLLLENIPEPSLCTG